MGAPMYEPRNLARLVKWLVALVYSVVISSRVFQKGSPRAIPDDVPGWLRGASPSRCRPRSSVRPSPPPAHPSPSPVHSAQTATTRSAIRAPRRS